MPNYINLGAIDPTKIDDNPLHQRVLANALKNIDINLFTPHMYYVTSLNGRHYEFSLTHHILRRLRTNDNKAYRFEAFKMDQHTGKGGFGSVYPIEKTLIPTTDNQIIQKDNNRVIKIEGNAKDKNFDDFQRKTMHEYNLSRRIHNRGFKIPVIVQKNRQTFQSLTVMKKLPGVELFDVINADLDNTRNLTIIERIDLSLALLRKLQTQIHDNDIIHRDLKPENNLVDLTQSNFNIIDLGLSKLANTPIDIDEKFGTLEYTSKEQLLEMPSNKISDGFSAGLTLAPIWRMFRQVKGVRINASTIEINEKKKLLMAAANEDTTYDISGLQEILGINSYETNFIESLIKKMTLAEPSKRLSIVDAIRELEVFRINQLFKKNNINNSKLQADVHRGCTNGNIVRNAIRELHARNNEHKFNLEEMNDVIIQNLNQLNDHPMVIEQFINSMDINYFRGLTSKQAVLNAIKKIDNAYLKQNKLLAHLKTAKETWKKYEPNNAFQDYKKLGLDTTNQMRAALRTKLKKSSPNFDGYVELANKFGSVFKPKDITINSVMAMLLDPNGTEGNTQLGQCKLLIKYSINEYIRTTYNAQNIVKKDRAASELRIRNAYATLDIVNNHQGTSDELIKKIKKHLNTVQHTSHSWLNNRFFRLFTRSQFVNNIEATISQLKQSNS